MARKARIIIPGLPHHVAQSSIGGQDIFIEKSDPQFYLDCLAENCKKFSVDVWAYCLMKNHVQLIAVPKNEKGLGQAFGETQRQYAMMLNKKLGRSGPLWYDRFQSYVVDDLFLRSAIKYIETAPVRAGITTEADKFLWSSARTHLGKCEPHPVLNDHLARQMIDNWGQLIQSVRFQKSNDNTDINTALKSEEDIIEAHLSTGRPLGNALFIDSIEMTIGKSVRPKKRGRKAKAV